MSVRAVLSRPRRAAVMPVALTAAGVALSGCELAGLLHFDALVAGPPVAVAVALAILAVPGRPADRSPASPAISVAFAPPAAARPAIGAPVRVVTHFGPAGGYVEHGDALFWAVAAERLQPGTGCTITGDAGQLRVAAATDGGRR